MKRLHFIISMLIACLMIHAQEAETGEQLLVFRNTGEVNLLYTNEVDSVLTTDTTQIFYSKDTVLIVPIAELDSVAIGSRNEAVYLNGVRKLTTNADLPWIIRFDGQSIYYRKDTPTNILPNVGMKLFYGLEEYQADNSIFPYGLSAKVSAITKLTDEIRVDIDLLELEEIFSRLFYAGRIYREMNVVPARKYAPHKASVNADINLVFDIPLGELGNINVHGKVIVSGDAVVGLRQSHVDLDLKYGYGVDVQLQAKENADYHFEELLGQTIRVGTFFGLLNIEVSAGAFADLSAELNFGMKMERSYHRKLLWDRMGDESSFEFRNVNGNGTYDDEAKIDLTLDGSLFFGPLLHIDFAPIGKSVGARAKVKIGPEITGDINMGMLANMRDYQPEAYGNAELTFCGKIAMEGYLINRHHLIWGDIDEHKIFTLDESFGKYNLQLFPDYQESTAVATTSITEELKTDMATYIPEPPLTDIETGFEIVDSSGEIVDSLFVGTILAESEDIDKEQTFDAEMVLPSTIRQEQLEGYTMRPIFHYAGYTISAPPVSVKKDVLLQPYTTIQSNGAMALISSGPFLGTAIQDSTLYTMGSYLPVPPKRRKIYDTYKPIEIGQIITTEKAGQLIGTWSGKMDDEDVILVFEEEGTGSMSKEGRNPRTFTYESNTPQTGDLFIAFDDEFEDILWRVISISESQLKVVNKRISPNASITFVRL